MSINSVANRSRDQLRLARTCAHIKVVIAVDVFCCCQSLLAYTANLSTANTWQHQRICGHQRWIQLQLSITVLEHHKNSLRLQLQNNYITLKTTAITVTTKPDLRFNYIISNPITCQLQIPIPITPKIPIPKYPMTNKYVICNILQLYYFLKRILHMPLMLILKGFR